MQPILGEIVEQAKLTILGSQLRVEIADKVVGALESLGYTLVDSESDAVYEGNDQRNAFVVKVTNIAGDEVVTVISPEKEFGANSVSINSFSQTLVDVYVLGELPDVFVQNQQSQLAGARRIWSSFLANQERLNQEKADLSSQLTEQLTQLQEQLVGAGLFRLFVSCQNSR